MQRTASPSSTQFQPVSNEVIYKYLGEVEGPVNMLDASAVFSIVIYLDSPSFAVFSGFQRSFDVRPTERASGLELKGPYGHLFPYRQSRVHYSTLGNLPVTMYKKHLRQTGEAGASPRRLGHQW